MLINDGLRILSCSLEDLSHEEKENVTAELNGDLEELSLFYDPTTDYIILNQDHENYDLYKLAAETFMKASSKKRSSIMSKIAQYGDETAELLDRIARRRERLHEERKALEIIRILGEHEIGPYLNSVDTLEVMKRIDPYRYSAWGEYDAFMYGYIQGIRAERARRKKVAL